MIFLMIPLWLICALLRLFSRGSWTKVYSEYTVAIIGSRSPYAIHIARHFRRLGYTVIGLESRRYMCAPLAWSRACDEFHWLPDPQEPPMGSGSEAYVEALWGYMLDFKPNLLIPLNRFTASEDQQVIEKISGTVDLLTPEPMEALKLSDLNIFYTGASDCNCKTPNFSLIPERGKMDLKGFKFENHPFVYRVYRNGMWGAKLIDTPSTPRQVSLMTQHITTQTPVLRIEKMEGPIVSICSLYCNRTPVAHAVSRKDGDLITSESDRRIEKSIIEWSNIFVERYTIEIEGWLSFDFMKSTDDGEWYPINCKPWITEPFTLLQNKSQDIVEGIELTTRGREACTPLTAPPDTRVRCLGGDLLSFFLYPYRASLLFRLLSFSRFPDILFLRSDPFPWFATYFIDLPMQLWLFWRTGTIWENIDYMTNLILTREQPFYT